MNNYMSINDTKSGYTLETYNLKENHKQRKLEQTNNEKGN